MFYYDWLLAKYFGKDSARGDLACDAHHEKDFPLTDEKDCILAYLKRKHACEECLEVFRRSFKDYEKFKSKIQ